MVQESTAPFIFFLTLEESLPKNFYIFDAIFKRLGIILVPVRVDQLQSLAASTSQEHLIVLSSVDDAREFKLFNEKVRSLLKYVLKSKRITFMQLASFSKLNDQSRYTITRNYFFFKYPLDARALAEKIVRYQKLKADETSRWPGGRRAGVNGVAS